MPVSLTTYDTIAAQYGAVFAQIWFHPVAEVKSTDT